MSNPLYVAVTRLSTRIVIGCLLVLAAADSAVAQSITVNGSSGAIEINRGATIAVAAGGGSAAMRGNAQRRRTNRLYVISYQTETIWP